MVPLESVSTSGSLHDLRWSGARVRWKIWKLDGMPFDPFLLQFEWKYEQQSESQ